MFDSPFSKLTIFLSLLFSSLIIFFIFLTSYFGSKTTIVFCDVGQGDGAYIRIKNRFDILVDAGPSRKILECLGKYMPFYDRTIELAILSHPQKDHFGGFLYILDRYDINKFWLNQVYGSSRSFEELLDKIETKDIDLVMPKAGEKAEIFGGKIEFFWPSDEFIDKNTFSDSTTHRLFRQTGLDTNEFSLIFSLDTGALKILFTGDASPLILNKLSDLPAGRQDQSKLKSDILKIPHHGSKNGLTVEFLKLADPTYGVISVGKNNSFGHPANEVLNMLEAQKVKVKRTDLEGDIVFKIQSSNVKSNPKSK